MMISYLNNILTIKLQLTTTILWGTNHNKYTSVYCSSYLSGIPAGIYIRDMVWYIPSASDFKIICFIKVN